MYPGLWDTLVLGCPKLTLNSGVFPVFVNIVHNLYDYGITGHVIYLILV